MLICILYTIYTYNNKNNNNNNNNKLFRLQLFCQQGSVLVMVAWPISLITNILLLLLLLLLDRYYWLLAKPNQKGNTEIGKQ